MLSNYPFKWTNYPPKELVAAMAIYGNGSNKFLEASKCGFSRLQAVCC